MEAVPNEVGVIVNQQTMENGDISYLREIPSKAVPVKTTSLGFVKGLWVLLRLSVAALTWFMVYNRLSRPRIGLQIKPS